MNLTQMNIIVMDVYLLCNYQWNKAFISPFYNFYQISKSHKIIPAKIKHPWFPTICYIGRTFCTDIGLPSNI